MAELDALPFGGPHGHVLQMRQDPLREQVNQHRRSQQDPPRDGYTDRRRALREDEGGNRPSDPSSGAPPRVCLRDEEEGSCLVGRALNFRFPPLPSLVPRKESLEGGTVMFRPRVKKAKMFRKRGRAEDERTEAKKRVCAPCDSEQLIGAWVLMKGQTGTDGASLRFLPEELQSRILFLLDLEDMLGLTVADSRHRRLVSGPSAAAAWKRVFRRRWGAENVSEDLTWRQRCIQGEAARTSKRFARQKQRHDDLCRRIDDDQGLLVHLRLSLSNDLAQLRKLTQAIGHELGVIEQAKSMPFPMVLSFGSKARVKGLRGDAELFESKVISSRAEQQSTLWRLKLSREERARIGGRLLRFQHKIETCARLTRRSTVALLKKNAAASRPRLF